MDELGFLKKKVALQEKRIKKLESAVYEDNYEDKAEEETSDVATTSVKPTRKDSNPGILFNQVITVLGILGIAIGMISFFFYAIANGWIGEAFQVIIGVLFGFVLFSIAYVLHEKNEIWSNIVFGGTYFIEYLSIGVGVSVYKIMPETLGVIFSIFILLSSMVLSIKFSSRIVAYFSLIGGFLIPIITNTLEGQIFVMFWYLFLLVALSGLSLSFDWGDLRLIMLGLIMTFVNNFFGKTGKSIEFIFLFFYFLFFNASSLINTILHRKDSGLVDSLILSLIPVFFLPLIYKMLPLTSSTRLFGLIVVLFSFFYLLEAFYLKTEKLDFSNAKYSLITAGVATLNFGIYFLFSEFLKLEFFMVFFIIQWALFSYLSSSSKDGFYKVVSYSFLILIVIWYAYILRFHNSIAHASFYMIVLSMIPLISFLYFRASIYYKENAVIVIISGYFFLYSFFRYLWFFFPSDSLNPLREIILSVLWLIYTLVLFVQVQTGDGKTLVGILLGITLLKIAFRDLFFLPEGFRIVGFILFGVLLLIGGYFLRNEKK